MNLKELLTKLEKHLVINNILKLYPKMKKNAVKFNKVYEHLLNLPIKKSNFSLLIESVEDTIEKEIAKAENNTSKTNFFYNIVRGIKENDDLPYNLMVTDWSEWLGMEFLPESIENYSEIDLASHCLWELTYCGFEPKDSQKFMKLISE